MPRRSWTPPSWVQSSDRATLERSFNGRYPPSPTCLLFVQFVYKLSVITSSVLDNLASKDLLASACDLVASSWTLILSTILFSNNLAVASCDLINRDNISSILELGRDCGVGTLLCLVSKATSSCSSYWPIKLNDCEAI